MLGPRIGPLSFKILTARLYQVINTSCVGHCGVSRRYGDLCDIQFLSSRKLTPISLVHCIVSHTFVVGPAYHSLRTQPMSTLGAGVERLPIHRSFVSASASAPDVCPFVGPSCRRRHRTSANPSVLRIGVVTERLLLRRSFVSAPAQNVCPSIGSSYRRQHRTCSDNYATSFFQTDGRRRRQSSEAKTS